MIHLSTPTQTLLPDPGAYSAPLAADAAPAAASDSGAAGFFARLLAVFTGTNTPPEPEQAAVPGAQDETGEDLLTFAAYEQYPAVNVQANIPVQEFAPAAFLGQAGEETNLAAVQERGADYFAHQGENFRANHAGEESDILSRRFEAAQSGREAAQAQNPLAAENAPVKNPGHVLYQGAAQGGERALAAELQDRNSRQRLTIDVRDLRTETASHAAPAPVPASGEVSLSAGLDPLQPEIEIPVELRAHGLDGHSARRTGSEAAQNRLFEDALARELRGNLSADIVKNATLIVRNGGEGTIRLALHPASLGQVKIHLEMTENKIMGHIIVESSEALRAFQKELPVLERAFRDSGFLETSLDMSLAQDRRDFDGEQRRQEADFPGVDAVMAASRYDAGAETIEEPFNADQMGLAVWPQRKSVNLFI